jgi:pilus assembly protein CpaD
MRVKLTLLLAGSLLAGGCDHVAHDRPDRGVAAVNEPVVGRNNYVFDAAAPNGILAPNEAARLDAWFRTLGVGYGDSIYVDGYGAARSDVERIANSYGMMVASGAPVTAGAVMPGAVRVIVSRTEAFVPNCPNWDRPSNPNYSNREMPNFGCAVNTNLAAMVANPTDLVHGQAGSGVGDAAAGAKAVNMYRSWPLTGVIEGQTRRPLKQAETKGEK